MKIKITWFEYFAAAVIGMLRKSMSLAKDHKDRYGSEMSTKPVFDAGWSVISAASEIAAAKALNRYWNFSVNTFKDSDLHELEIKCQMHYSQDPAKNENYLIIRPEFNDLQKYMLVICHSHTRYELAGYIHGSEAKLDKYKAQSGTRPWFYKVPIDALSPARDLL
tara:strand:+ start:2144 stop:2638 length:495 start_codon:yes stop_codon:yes gene_type:complete